MKQVRVDSFLFEFKRWAATEPQILAVGLIGSYARGAATEASDLDLIVIVSAPNIYLKHKQWTALFGEVTRDQIEDYGARISLRVWFDDGLEVEFAFSGENWAASPLDEGTRQVLSGGMKVLFERRPILSTLLAGVRN